MFHNPSYLCSVTLMKRSEYNDEEDKVLTESGSKEGKSFNFDIHNPKKSYMNYRTLSPKNHSENQSSHANPGTLTYFWTTEPSKADHPVHPVVSFYKVAKYLGHWIMAPVDIDMPHSVPNSEVLTQKIKEIGSGLL